MRVHTKGRNDMGSSGHFPHGWVKAGREKLVGAPQLDDNAKKYSTRSRRSNADARGGKGGSSG